MNQITPTRGLWNNEDVISFLKQEQKKCEISCLIFYIFVWNRSQFAVITSSQAH